LKIVLQKYGTSLMKNEGSCVRINKEKKAARKERVKGDLPLGKVLGFCTARREEGSFFSSSFLKHQNKEG